MAPLLYGIELLEPAVIGVAVTLLIAVCSIAVSVPSYRVRHMGPAQVLRETQQAEASR